LGFKCDKANVILKGQCQETSKSQNK